MSGGVDSSVAAGMMVEAGHEVIGLTMKLRDTTPEERSGKAGSCCSPDDLMDARLVCDTLGIPHYVVDYRDLFRQAVMEPFAQSYLQGRTPNPCIACNDHVKFLPLIERGQALGADLLVTGHYARIQKNGNGGYELWRGVDPSKDQSYFLFGLEQDILSRTQFPLGELDKDEVRDRAKAMGLPNWDKADSEDICFVPNGNYSQVVEQIVGDDFVRREGAILDEAGNQLGEHKGIHFTVGQRKGLGIAHSERLYVLDINDENHVVTVGSRDSLMSVGLKAERCNWILGSAPGGLQRYKVRIRYRHQGNEADVLAVGDNAMVTFDEPISAVATGQAAVFYDGDQVVGGGWIESAAEAAHSAAL